MTWSRTGQSIQRLRSLGTVYLYRYENDKRPYDRRILGAIKFAIALIEEARASMSEADWEQLVSRARERDIRFPPTAELRQKEARQEGEEGRYEAEEDDEDDREET